MDIELTPIEARVLGSLIEKELTTPEQYPLSLNALVNACNQKSNRDPVMSLSESDVQDGLDGLSKKLLVSEKEGFGSRVVKYKQRLCGTEFSELRLNEREIGVLCVMLVRGPQTPGELRTRTNRLCQFDDVKQVEKTLTHLMTRDDGPFVQRLAREPGKRDARYMQLFCADDACALADERDVGELAPFSQQQLQELVDIVSGLKAEISLLKSDVARLSDKAKND